MPTAMVRTQSSKTEQRRFLTVMAIATPINNIYTPRLIGTVPGSCRNSLYNPQAIAQPKPNGTTMPTKLTPAAIFQFLERNRRSTSRPTRNRNRTKPRLATVERMGIVSVGKMCLVKPGTLPMTEGPRIIPPMTSAITRGWRIRDNG